MFTVHIRGVFTQDKSGYFSNSKVYGKNGTGKKCSLLRGVHKSGVFTMRDFTVHTVSYSGDSLPTICRQNLLHHSNEVYLLKLCDLLGRKLSRDLEIFQNRTFSIPFSRTYILFLQSYKIFYQPNRLVSYT